MVLACEGTYFRDKICNTRKSNQGRVTVAGSSGVAIGCYYTSCMWVCAYSLLWFCRAYFSWSYWVGGIGGYIYEQIIAEICISCLSDILCMNNKLNDTDIKAFKDSNVLYNNLWIHTSLWQQNSLNWTVLISGKSCDVGANKWQKLYTCYKLLATFPFKM